MNNRKLIPFRKKKTSIFYNVSSYKTAEQFFSEYKVRKLDVPEEFVTILQDNVLFRNYVFKHNNFFSQTCNLQLRSEAEKISIAKSIISCDKSLLRLLN